MNNWTFHFGNRRYPIPNHPEQAWNRINKILFRRFSQIKDIDFTCYLASQLKKGCITDSTGKDKTFHVAQSMGQYLQLVERNKRYAELNRRKRAQRLRTPFRFAFSRR